MSEEEQAVNALLVAFVTQAFESGSPKFAAAALEALASEGRATVRVLLGCIGHMVHYGATGEDNAYTWLADLFEEIIAALRGLHEEKHGLRPGDLVEVTTARPDLYLEPGTLMRVYWVGDDDTVDLGYESLSDEYVISTVSRSDIQKRSPS